MRNPQCNLCSFGVDSPRANKNICLMPEELKQCDVMLIAETPLYNDDLEGIPWAGKGLQEIRSFFSKANIPVHCSYAMKCPKPTRETKVKDTQIKVCALQYLQEEIKQVKPRHIICFGAGALYGATLAKGFTSLQSSRILNPKLDAYVYATIHQAQAMYNQERKDQLGRDLRRFREWVVKGDEVTTFDPPVYIADSLNAIKKLRRLIKESGGEVAVDTETQGLNQYLPNKNIRCIQFCWDEDFGGVFVPLILEPDCYYTNLKQTHNFWPDWDEFVESMQIIRKILLESDVDWQNGKFDRIWLHEWGTRVFGKPILAPNINMDTMHVAHIIDENRPIGLKKLIVQELGVPSYDIPDKLTKDLDVLIPYATKDTVAGRILARKYKDTLESPGYEKLNTFYHEVIREADRLFTDIELRGWPVDREECLHVKSVIEREFHRIDAEMHQILQEKGCDCDSKVFASPQKLGKLLFEQLNYPMNPNKAIAYTETGAPSTGEEALVHLKGHRFVALLLKWRNHAKALSTYVEPMLRAADNRGRISTSYNLTGTVTGRTASGKEKMAATSARSRKSADGMNLQNIIRDSYGEEEASIRDIIVARHGWSIVEVDFSQIELRVAGWLSRDPFFLDAYARGMDIHTLTAQMIMGLTEEQWAKLPKEKQKEYRQRAKAVNFGFLYGMGARTFQQYALTDYGVEFTLDECYKIREKYFEEHTGLEPWYLRQERQALRLGYVESPSGRRRHLPNINLDPQSSKEARRKYQEAVRYAINMPVQGFASDLKLMSAIEIDGLLYEDEAYMFGEVHDSILFEIRNDCIDYYVPKIVNVMRHPEMLDRLGIDLTVPIDAEAKVGQSWGKAKVYAVAA